MKIGRNAPCPCGSGKKYKKCCLKTKVTPPEFLQYRRLSEAIDKLMPRLIDHGISVFGQRVLQVAMHEFAGWPDPEDIPDDETFDRFGMLFWPWFAFNWEYEGPVDEEDPWLDGPQEVTVAELFMDRKKIDPNSMEGKLLAAANRKPYSFLEIIGVQPSQSLRIRDILTGAEMTVQERLGSEQLGNGDILFGRALQVDEVGMFLGLCDYALPPRVKPQLIELRRIMRRGFGKITDEALYEYDMEIRNVYLDIDQALHTPLQMQNTDGDPLEPHKLVYNIDSPERAIEKLASLSATETADEIRAAATKSKDGEVIRAHIDWSRPGNPVNKGMHNTILGNITIEKDRMTVTVNSARRAETIRKRIDQRLGTAARFRLDEISDLEPMTAGQMQSRAGEPLAPDELMQNPEVHQHIDRMLRSHWEDWVNQKLPALGFKTPRQASKTAEGREAVEALLLDSEKMLENDPLRKSIESEIIADVRRRLKLDRPMEETRSPVDPGKVAEQVAKVKKRIAEFGEKRLHDTYSVLAANLCDAVAASELLRIDRGRVEIWAAAIVYAIAQLNFLFSAETPNHLTPDELCDWFQTKQSTVSNKAYKIRSSLETLHNDERFCAPHITEMFKFLIDDQGFAHAAVERNLEPLPLKPSARRSPEPTPAAAGKKKSEPGDDKQLSLFDE